MSGAHRPVVAMVHLGRTGGMGARVRKDGLADIFEQAGADIVDVPLLVDHRAGPGDLLHPGLGAVVAGRTVPESLAWSHRSARAALEEIGPAVVVCATARSYHPILNDGPWTVVLDYVDRLSDSYRDRALIRGRSLASVGYRGLSTLAARFEARPVPSGMIGIAAGWADAQALGLEWVPITRRLPPEPVAVAPTHDVVFVGKLSYEPNVEAIERLARMWPAIERRRPSTTMLLAGARPTPQVLEVAEQLGWTVEIDFPDLGELMGRVRVAAVPLVHASGIQTKVLDAAMYGVAQVMSPIAAEGLGPDFPTVVADGDERFVDAIVELLDDPPRLLDLGRRSREHFAETYTPGRWVGWAERTLATADSARRRGD